MIIQNAFFCFFMTQHSAPCRARVMSTDLPYIFFFFFVFTQMLWAESVCRCPWWRWKVKMSH